MTADRLNPLHLVAAFGSGGLLTLMIHFNAELARYGNALFSSWTAHGAGMVVAVLLVGLMTIVARPAGAETSDRNGGGAELPGNHAAAMPTAPLWAYLGGVSGAVTVMMSSVAANSPIALSGTLALGLAGQVLFSLAADRFGLFGLAVERSRCTRPDRLGQRAHHPVRLRMIAAIALALSAGILVGVSRQLNGRLALSTSPLVASLWNHGVGFVALTLVAVAIGGPAIGALIPPGAADAPWFVFVGGPLGVVFVASGSLLIARIGAVNTTLLVIAGQMVSGVALDLLRDRTPAFWATALGIALILAGTVLMQRRSG
jgi:transporter family-2 protein